MNKNLNVDHYRNGDTIPEITNGVEWPNLTTGAWCYYHNSDSLGNIYGKLYNWYAVNDPRGLAPQGWHVATDSDWIVLVNYLGGPDIAGGKLKEEGTRHWLIPNSGANNQSGFSAIPGGCRKYNGLFIAMGTDGFWLTSTMSNFYSPPWERGISNERTNVGRAYSNKIMGYSVRCIKD